MTLHSEAAGNLAKPIAEIVNKNYIIPLYQRSFAWGEDEIQLLIQDIYESYSKDSHGSYFIGSLILILRSDGQFEVIDGQQRLTVISLLLKYLFPSNYSKKFLSYDSRKDVDSFLEDYFARTDTTFIDELYIQKKVNRAVSDIITAILAIGDTPMINSQDKSPLFKDTFLRKSGGNSLNIFLKMLKWLRS